MWAMTSGDLLDGAFQSAVAVVGIEWETVLNGLKRIPEG